ncbi:ribonuclease H-like domain-containing protein [Tanacetum coccineum]
MLNCIPLGTPIDIEEEALGPEGSPGSLIILYYRKPLPDHFRNPPFSRPPNLSYAVQKFCLYMLDPRELHTLMYETCCPGVYAPIYILDTGCFFLVTTSWSLTKRPRTRFSRSSAELNNHGELRNLGVANVVAKTSWIRNLLRELHTPFFTVTLVYSVVYMSANPVQHQRTKHIEIDIHFVRDKVAAVYVRVLHVPSRFQYADIFTKCLPYPLFAHFRSGLSVRKTLAPTAGAY